jgi:hypothetical protein
MSITLELEFQKAEQRFLELVERVRSAILARNPADAQHLEMTRKICDAWLAAGLETKPENKTWSHLTPPSETLTAALQSPSAPRAPSAPVYGDLMPAPDLDDDDLDLRYLFDEDDVNDHIIISRAVDAVMLLPNGDSTVTRSKKTYRLDGGSGVLYTRSGKVGLKRVTGNFTRS